MMFEATLEPPKKFDHLPPGNRRSSASLTSFANRVSRCARNIALVRAVCKFARWMAIVLCGAQITASIGSGGCLKVVGATITRAIQPGWRNWQTRWIQNPLSERACGFKSHSGHSDPYGAATPSRFCPFGLQSDFPPQSHIRLRLCVLCGLIPTGQRLRRDFAASQIRLFTPQSQLRRCAPLDALRIFGRAPQICAFDGK